MNLTQWLEAEGGRPTALAAHCGITCAAVSQWKTNGVPLHHVRRVASFTSGDVPELLLISQILERAESRNQREVA